MRVAAFTLLVATASFPAFASGAPPCTAESPWDDIRKALENNAHDPEFVPVASIDGGQLLEAMNEWFAARAGNDAQQLETMIIPLGMHYNGTKRSWIQTVLDGGKYDVARPLLAQVGPSNPLHVRVLSEVAVRIVRRCSMSVAVCEWVKLDGSWKVLPSGPRIVG